MKEISQLEEKLQVKFKEPKLLEQSVVHRSYLNEHPEFELQHNERLEFLGDAVLELIVTQHLFNNYQNPEGELTNWRAALVNAVTLGEIAQALGIEDFLYLSKGEAKDVNTKARQIILANAMEAVIGAIYLDQGYDAAKEFVLRTVVVRLPEILEKKLYKDPKSRFQEIAQETMNVTPNYRVLSETGPDHAKEFNVGVYLGGEKIAEGLGSSKQEAQVAAAKKGLEVKGWE